MRVCACASSCVRLGNYLLIKSCRCLPGQGGSTGQERKHRRPLLRNMMIYERPRCFCFCATPGPRSCDIVSTSDVRMLKDSFFAVVVVSFEFIKLWFFLKVVYDSQTSGTKLLIAVCCFNKDFGMRSWWIMWNSFNWFQPSLNIISIFKVYNVLLLENML